MIRWQCPQCESTLGAPEWSVGRRVPCPVCTNGIKVPPASDDDPLGGSDDEDSGKKKGGLCGCIAVFAIVLFFIFVVIKLLT